MPLWSLHPNYLDPQGLVALWREALLAQAVLAGKTRGHENHPQLRRFQETRHPKRSVAEYLKGVHAEAVRRGCQFDAHKICRCGRVQRLGVTRGQLSCEAGHLQRKLQGRAPGWVNALGDLNDVEAHPLFRATEGGVEDREIL